MKILEAQIEIQAPVEVVWKHLTDFDSYPQWNPYIPKAEGDLREGGIVRFRVARQPIAFTAPIVSLVENEELIWEANVPFPGLKPRYIRRLTQVDDDITLFINREEFTGRLIPLANPLLNVLLKPYFPTTCEALKQYVEQQVK